MKEQLRRYVTLFAGLFLLFSNQSSHAEIILSEWSLNLDGSVYESFLGDTMPGTNTFDANGLGSLTFDVTGAGNHTLVSFFDFQMIEIDPGTNTFFNEYGVASGSVAAGQSWEIDEPGFAFGDIYDHLRAGQLDNFNNIAEGANDDVSFALGWDFFLADTEQANITFNLTDNLAELTDNMFYLAHVDPDSNESVYIWSTLTIASTVPEPSSLGLFLSAGLVLLLTNNRRKRYDRQI